MSSSYENLERALEVTMATRSVSGSNPSLLRPPTCGLCQTTANPESVGWLMERQEIQGPRADPTLCDRKKVSRARCLHYAIDAINRNNRVNGVPGERSWPGFRESPFSSHAWF